MITEEIKTFHTELNPDLWNNFILKPEVREKILELVNEFQSKFELPLNIVDIHLVGSNASYNYNEHSDIDVHIITNFSDYGESKEFVETSMNALKSNFNSSYDVSYKGHEVELYIEDIDTTAKSNGVYSVLNDAWVKAPEKIEPIDVELEPQLSEYTEMCETALESETDEDIVNAINKLYMLRIESLATDGEFGAGNLVFKEIRNKGLLDELKQKKVDLRSKELSLEELER